MQRRPWPRSRLSLGAARPGAHKRRFEALDAGGSRLYSARYHRAPDLFPDGPTWAALYCGLSYGVCLAEVLRHVTPETLPTLKNLRLSRVTVDFATILDCRDVAGLGVDQGALFHDTDYTVGQALGAAAVARGCGSGATALSYQIQSVGALPNGAVAPGAHWTTTASVTTTATAGNLRLPAVHMTVRSVFRGYKQLDGQRVAVITSSGPLQYLVNMVILGHRFHIHATGRVTGQTLFGLVTHRDVYSTGHTDMRMFLQIGGLGGKIQQAHLHFVQDMTEQAVSA